MTEDIRTEELLFMAKKIGLDLTSQLEFYLGDQEMSGVQAYFMVYILRHHPEGTYLTELCCEIGLSKSTLSAMLKKVRKAGYILFREEPEDIRKKKSSLQTNSGLRMNNFFGKRTGWNQSCSVCWISRRRHCCGSWSASFCFI